MQESTIPWKQIIEFHREIAIRSEESFFSFDMDDQGSERFSYMRNEAVQKMQVDSRMRLNMFSNQLIFTNIDQKNSEFYIGGIFWFTNKMIDGKWIKIAHPLFYKAFNIKKDVSERLEIEPEQAKWDISPTFYKLLDKKGIVSGILRRFYLILLRRLVKTRMKKALMVRLYLYLHQNSLSLRKNLLKMLHGDSKEDGLLSLHLKTSLLYKEILY